MIINNLKMFSYIFKNFFYFRKFVTGHIEYLRVPYVARGPWVGHHWSRVKFKIRLPITKKKKKVKIKFKIYK
jgi:hypothetical protein